jgi:hypothetical protein
MEPYQSGQFGFSDDPDSQFGNSSGWTRTLTRSDGPEPLRTLAGTPCLVSEPEHLNTFESIEAILAATFEEEPLKFNFVKSQRFPPLGIPTGQTQSKRVADWILTILCLGHIGLDIQEHTPGSPVIPKNLVTAKDIIAQELTRQLDT